MILDLCTVTNSRYIKNALLLIESYKRHRYNYNHIYLYYFGVETTQLQAMQMAYPDIIFLNIPKVCSYAHEDRIFFYKTYVLHDMITRSDAFIYSDATNLFTKNIDISDYLIHNSLLLPYNENRLQNQYWTTKKCFTKMNTESSYDKTQYWAGFQTYVCDENNKKFISEMYDYMLDPEIALPSTDIDYPDGPNSPCISHRQDQSVLSLLIDKNNRHPEFNIFTQYLFGDLQTFQLFNKDYSTVAHNVQSCIASRASKNI